MKYQNALLISFVAVMLSVSGLFAQNRQIPGFQMPPRTKSIRIPVEIQHNVIIIPLRINGSFEMNFILDTGVRSTILTEPLIANFIELDSLTRIKVRGLGEGEPIDAILARDVSIQLPGVKGTGMNLLVLPEGVISYSGMFGRPVYGIIGYDVFSQFVVEVNYARKYIRLHDAFEFKPRRRAATIPLQLRQGKPYIQATMTDFEGREIAGNWLLDTGSSNAIALFDGELPVPEQSIPAFLGKGLSGNVYGRLARAPTFQLGPYQFEEVIAGYPDSSSLNFQPQDTLWYGNIGAEILSRFLITFDYYRGQVYLKKVWGWRQPFEYNVSGIEVITDGDSFENIIVSYVRPGSPAAEAGVRIGDQLLNLNGFDVTGMDISTVYGTLLKRNGRMLVLKLKRGDETLKLKFRLVREI